MGGFCGVATKNDCVFDLFFGTDYHSHLGTRRAGMIVYGEKGFDRAIHNIENSPFRTKFEKDVNSMRGNLGIGVISDYEPQPLLIRSALTTVPTRSRPSARSTTSRNWPMRSSRTAVPTSWR